MNTLIHADIFFFVTTVVVVLIGFLFIIAIIYVVRILNDLHYVTGIVRRETDLLAADIDEIREEVKKEGIFRAIYAVITSLFRGSDADSSKRSVTNRKRKESKR